MSKLKLSKTQQVYRYLDNNPTATAKEIHEKFKVPMASVYALRCTHRKRTNGVTMQQIEAVSAKLKQDLINNPPHYTAGGIETIDFIRAKLTPDQFKGFLLGNIIKYSSRIGRKGEEVQDAGKLNWYTKTLAAAYTGKTK